MEPSDDITLERAEEDEARLLAGISRRAFHGDVSVGVSGTEGGPPGYDSPEYQVRLMRWGDYKLRYDGRVVGALIVAKVRADYYECAQIFVEPDYQHRGIATSAFEHVWDRHPSAKI